MKKTISILALLFVLLFLVSCGNNEYFTVSFDSDGGTEIASIQVPKFEGFEKPTDPKREDYIFDGWYVDGEKWSFIDSTVKSNITLKAKWIREYYNVTFDFNDETTSNVNYKFKTGEAINVELEPTRIGYKFNGWDSNVPDVMDDKDYYFKANWEKIVPTDILIKGNNRVLINSILELKYIISPSNAQEDIVSIEVDNDLATVVLSGTDKIIFTAGSAVGITRITITTSNGKKAMKAIQIIDGSSSVSYPDLGGYRIKIAVSENELGQYDPHLTSQTKSKYGYYDKPDRDYRIAAFNEIEENYNCSISFEPYPADAQWGLARKQYILTQGQIGWPEYDIYIYMEGQNPGYEASNAFVDLTELYAKYGHNLMNEMNITANTYKQKLYGINTDDIDLVNILAYNVGLWEMIHEKDPTIKEPAQMFLDGEWDFDAFKEYCIKVQNVFKSLSAQYYCLSGYGSYYWLGLVNASGVKILDTTQLSANISGPIETAAAQILKEIYAAGAMDPSFQVDANVATWNAGHALFCTGDLWFINSDNRWKENLWGTDTRYGYVPFPHMTGTDSECTFVGTTTGSAACFASSRDWSYRGFGKDCTFENIFRAYMDFLYTAKELYRSSDNYSLVSDVTNTATSKFGSEASVNAYLKMMLGSKQSNGTYVGGINVYGFYDPFISSSNSVVGNVGDTGTFAGEINAFIKGSGGNSWSNAVANYQATIESALVDVYG